MILPNFSRRTLLIGAVATVLPAGAVRAAGLALTPRQTEGPFYPTVFPADADNDLVQVRGQAARAMGTVLHLEGRVLDASGRPCRARASRSGSAIRKASTIIRASPAASGATRHSRATARCWRTLMAATVSAR